MINHNSMLYWYPLTKNLPVPQPRTEFVLQKDGWWKYLDRAKFSKKDTAKLPKSAKSFGYPLFMRTDLASGKHDYLDSCYVDKEQSLLPNLRNLIEQNALHDLWFSAIVFREYLHLDYRFLAFNGLPIASERRYFIKDGRVVCRHPYWIEDAIRFYQRTKNQEERAWQKWLKELNTESETEIKTLSHYARKVASVLDGAWSVDFAKDSEGKWWLIDCAEAAVSWHPDCPHNSISQEV